MSPPFCFPFTGSPWNSALTTKLLLYVSLTFQRLALPISPKCWLHTQIFESSDQPLTRINFSIQKKNSKQLCTESVLSVTRARASGEIFPRRLGTLLLHLLLEHPWKLTCSELISKFPCGVDRWQCNLTRMCFECFKRHVWMHFVCVILWDTIYECRVFSFFTSIFLSSGFSYMRFSLLLKWIYNY